MPFVIEQKSIPSEVPNSVASDSSASTIIVVLFLIYFFRNFIFATFKFGLIAVLGLTLYNFIR